MGGRLLAHRPRGHGFRGPHLLQGLPPSPLRLRRDDGRADRLAAQHRILPAAGRHGPRAHRGRGFQTLEGGDGRKTEQKTVTRGELCAFAGRDSRYWTDTSSENS